MGEKMCSKIKSATHSTPWVRGGMGRLFALEIYCEETYQYDSLYIFRFKTVISNLHTICELNVSLGL